jgi:hypothetical protein
MASAGIGALLDARSHAAARHRALILVDVQDDLREALSLAGVDEALIVASGVISVMFRVSAAGYLRTVDRASDASLACPDPT